MEEVNEVGEIAFPEELKTKILVIAGATASGKTYIAVLCARQLNAEIISADSRQIYKLMSIGTAKPGESEKKNIPHHFVDELSPDTIYSAGEFGKEAADRIKQITARGKRVIVAGGSGLYIRSIVEGMFTGPPANPEIRKMLEERLQQSGIDALYDELRQIDPISAGAFPRQNRHRLLRALEIYYTSGVPMSRLHQLTKARPEYCPVQAGIEWERKMLYERIDARVDKMIRDGLVQEVQSLFLQGFDETIPAMNTVGYKEVCSYLKGIYTYDEMIARIKQHSRNFAKRQLTWFRKDKRIQWFAVGDEKEFGNVAGQISELFLHTIS